MACILCFYQMGMVMATPPKPPSSSRPPTDAESSPDNLGDDEGPQDALPPVPSMTGPERQPATLVFGETQYGDTGDGPLHIPGYEILGELGRGGMGVVYKARQLQLGRLVALKMSRSGDLNAEDMARFRAEAEAVARLRHPNIVQIYDVGECQGRPYFSFEYVEGGSLAEMLRGTPQPPRSSAEMVETLARAMHVGHEHGIIHRDLKPANVLLGGARETAHGSRDETWPLQASAAPRCVPKIADFGVAKRLDKHSMHTATGAVLGTPNYMAPEQAWGSDKRRPVGPPADVYALGAILYEMLTGRPPFLGETPLDTLQQVVTQEPVAPTRLQPKIPKDLETICLKCLQKEPARRYASAEELAEDLRRFLDDRQIHAKAAGAVTRVLRWRRRNPAVAALLVIALLLLLTGTAVSTYFAIQATLAADDALAFARQAKENEDTANQNARMAAASEQIAKKNAREAEENAKQARQNLLERDRVYYGSKIAFANRALQEKDGGRVLDILTSLIPGEDSGEDLRGFEWHYLRRQCGGKPLTLNANDGPVQSMAFSPDGIAATVNAGSANQGKSYPIEIRLWELQSGRPLGNAIKGFGKSVNAIAFRQDGKRLASASDDGLVKVWDTALPGDAVAVCGGHLGAVTCVQFSADGKFLVSASVDQTVRFWEPDTGKIISISPKMPDAVEWVALHPTGETVAIACRDGSIIVWDKVRGKELNRFVGHAGPVLHVAWHPNGKELASASTDGTIRMWDVIANDSVGPPLRHHAARVNQVAFSPDGNYLASVSDDKTLRLFSAGSQMLLKTFIDHAAEVRCLNFAADGTLLASAAMDGTVIVRPLGIRPAVRNLAGHTARVDDIAWSADGTLLASSRGVKVSQDDPTAGSEVILWNLVTTRPRYTLSGHAQRVYHLAFQPKGKLLATASQDGTICFWEPDTGNQVKEIGKQRQAYYALAWSPDGKRLATTRDFDEEGKAVTRVTIWDVDSGNQVNTFTCPQYWMESLAWSPDGKWLAGGSSEANTVWLWQAATGDLVHQFQGHLGPIYGLAFSADSRLLASAGADSTARVWDVLDKKELQVLKGHAGTIRAVAFHPSDKRLATAGDDKLVKLWDLGTHQEILTFPPNTEPVLALAFRPDGHQLATASRDGIVRIFDATPLLDDAAK
jgi:eukaryotic-like serine/threonine-protein kinase